METKRPTNKKERALKGKSRLDEKNWKIQTFLKVNFLHKN